MTCQECIDDLVVRMPEIPLAWAIKIATALCEQKARRGENVMETVTSLSAFTITGTKVCVTYTNETLVPIERCFDFADNLNVSWAGINPKCLDTQAGWDAKTRLQKVQLIINSACTNCS